MYRSVLDYFRNPDDMAGTHEVSRHHIYCDGACIANGKRGARASYGISIQENGVEKRAISALLTPTDPQTNQRAELLALYESMKVAMTTNGSDIYTDSEYAMNCLQEWSPRWAARGWKKADGGPVLHQDLLKPMFDIWRNRGTKIRLFHIKAHTGHSDIHSKGNERADALARMALSG
jgi:ribonuclease HI